MTKFDSIYQEQLLELPELERSAVQSLDWQTVIIQIGKKYGLHLEELEELRTETMLVLVGATESNLYYDRLISELAVSPSIAEKIVSDVNTQILTPIQAYIMRGGPIGSPASVPETQAFQARIVPNLDTTLKIAGIQLVEEAPEADSAHAHISPGTLAYTGIVPATEDPNTGFEPLSEKSSSVLAAAAPHVPTETEEAIPLSPAVSPEHHDTPLADTLTKLLAEKKLGTGNVSTPESHNILI